MNKELAIKLADIADELALAMTTDSTGVDSCNEELVMEYGEDAWLAELDAHKEISVNTPIKDIRVLFDKLASQNGGIGLLRSFNRTIDKVQSEVKLTSSVFDLLTVNGLIEYLNGFIIVDTLILQGVIEHLGYDLLPDYTELHVNTISLMLAKLGHAELSAYIGALDPMELQDLVVNTVYG